MQNRDLPSTEKVTKNLKRKATETDLVDTKANDQKKLTNEKIQTIAETVASIYTQIIELNEKDSKYMDNPSGPFALPRSAIPQLSLHSFLTRLCRAAMFPETVETILITAFIYIDKFINAHSQFKLTKYNIFPLVITSILTASKFLIDGSQQNSLFAEAVKDIGVKSIDIKLLNKYEAEFLFIINFNLFIPEKVYQDYADSFRTAIPLHSQAQEVPSSDSSVSAKRFGK